MFFRVPRAGAPGKLLYNVNSIDLLLKMLIALICD